MASRATNCLLAVLTDDFGDSRWTDQEVGFAFGADKLVIPLALRQEPPHGLIARFQAVPGRNEGATVIARRLIEALFNNPITKDRVTKSLLAAFIGSESYAQSNNLIGYIERIELDDTIVDRLRNALEINSQIYGATRARRRLQVLIQDYEEGQIW